MSIDRNTISCHLAPAGGLPADRDHQGSVERLIDRLRDGDDAALAPLWERYFERLVKVCGDASR